MNRAKNSSRRVDFSTQVSIAGFKKITNLYFHVLKNVCVGEECVIITIFGLFLIFIKQIGQ